MHRLVKLVRTFTLHSEVNPFPEYTKHNKPDYDWAFTSKNIIFLNCIHCIRTLIAVGFHLTASGSI